jgi:hypothetical protein
LRSAPEIRRFRKADIVWDDGEHISSEEVAGGNWIPRAQAIKLAEENGWYELFLDEQVRAAEGLGCASVRKCTLNGYRVRVPRRDPYTPKSRAGGTVLAAAIFVGPFMTRALPRHLGRTDQTTLTDA